MQSRVTVLAYSQKTQKCCSRGVMEGRMCGEVVEAKDEHLRGCFLHAAYRISFDPTVDGGDGSVYGTLEGSVISVCE